MANRYAVADATSTTPRMHSQDSQLGPIDVAGKILQGYEDYIAKNWRDYVMVDSGLGARGYKALDTKLAEWEDDGGDPATNLRSAAAGLGRFLLPDPQDPISALAVAAPVMGNIAKATKAAAKAEPVLGAIKWHESPPIKLTEDIPYISGEVLNDRGTKLFHASKADFDPKSGFKSGTDKAVTNETGYGGQMHGDGVYLDDNQHANLLNNAWSIAHGHTAQGQPAEKVYQYIAKPTDEMSEKILLNLESPFTDLKEFYPELAAELQSVGKFPTHREYDPQDLRNMINWANKQVVDPDMRKTMIAKFVAEDEVKRKKLAHDIGFGIKAYMQGIKNNVGSHEASRQAVSDLMSRYSVGGAAVRSPYAPSSIAQDANEWVIYNPKDLSIIDKNEIPLQDLVDYKQQVIQLLTNRR